MTGRAILPGIVLAASAIAGPLASQQHPPGIADQPLPTDPAVTVGRLPNGLTYYVRENRRPARRADLRLVVNAGSVLEDPDQLGLAHFVEHMAFNGTTHFEKQELVDYLERIGARFGADVNAQTGFDETIYLLEVPTDTASILAQGMQILEDWAHGVTFDTAEIRKERGVVIEEWRLGRGAGGRMRDRTLPVILRGTPYADRLPIGTRASLESFTPAALRRFYRDWYRPDLMAVVAVGDFDGKQIERLIKRHFGAIPRPRRPRVRPRPGMRPNARPEAVVASDPEAVGTNVSVLFRRPARRGTGLARYRADLVAGLYGEMLNQRLAEIAQRPEAPFLRAGGGIQPLVRSVDAFSLGAVVADTGVAAGLEAILTEAQRVERHGFIAPELERTRRNLTRSLESAHEEREHTESAYFAGRYVAHFTDQEPMLSSGQELELGRRLLGEIPLAEVNRVAHDWLSLEDRVVVVNTVERSAGPVEPDSLLAIVERVGRADVSPYVETLPDAELVATRPTEAAVRSERTDSTYGISTWVLGNGVRVILMPTTFKADEVLLQAYSPGGASLVPDSLYGAGRAAVVAAQVGGLGEFSAVDLEKKLSGTRAQVSPWMSQYYEGVYGSASPRDLETLLELIYLGFTAPRADSAAFEAYRRGWRIRLADRQASPQAAFQDTLAAVLADHHPAARPLTAPALDSVELSEAMHVYRDRFRDASDFTFVLVGSFTLDSIRPLVRRWLGNLPAAPGREAPRDLGIRPPRGVVEREVRKGIEQQSTTRIVFTGSYRDTAAERVLLNGLAEVLQLRLRAEIREERGGAYAPSVSAQLARFPRPDYGIHVQFGSDPARADELAKVVFAQVDALRRDGPTDAEVAKIRETTVRERETGLRQNGFWLAWIREADESGEPLAGLLDLQATLRALTAGPLREAARRYLDTGNFVRVTLLPARAAEGSTR
jgi:zinc protease